MSESHYKPLNLPMRRNPGMTHKEIAERLGISRSRVVTIENQAIRKLIAGGALRLLRELEST